NESRFRHGRGKSRVQSRLGIPRPLPKRLEALDFGLGTVGFGLWTALLSFATSQGCLKGGGRNESVSRQLPALAPLRTMLDDPIRQRPFESDVATGLFRLDPLMFENLLALGLKFAVQIGVFQQIAW